MGCIGDIYRVRIILEVDVRIQLVSRDIGDVVGQSKMTSAQHVLVTCGSLLRPIGVRHVRNRIVCCLGLNWRWAGTYVIFNIPDHRK